MALDIQSELPGKRKLTDLLFGLISVILWGLSFTATKLVLRELTPITVVFARTLLASLFLVGFAAIRRESLQIPRTLWLPIAIAGAFGIFVHQLLQAYALTYTIAIRTGWLIEIIPIGVFLAQRPSEVGHQTLDLRIQVRSLAPKPFFTILYDPAERDRRGL